MQIQEREQIIKEVAKHYNCPIGDFKGLNELLFNDYGIRTTKLKVAKLLRFI